MKRKVKLIAVLLFFSGALCAQSRVFLKTGFTQSFGGNLSTYLSKSPMRLTIDLEVDRKVLGSLYFVSGVSMYNVGYSSKSNFFGPANSDFNAQYLAVPLLARWNVGNRNFWYIDLGLSTFYLANAHLKESIDKFHNGQFTVYEGDITRYLGRVIECFKFEETVAFNRFSFSIFFLYQFKGQGSISNLGEHWGLNAQQSTFLSSQGYSNFNIGGIKIGCRIR